MKIKSTNAQHLVVHPISPKIKTEKIYNEKAPNHSGWGFGLYAVHIHRALGSFVGYIEYKQRDFIGFCRKYGWIINHQQSFQPEGRGSILSQSK